MVEELIKKLLEAGVHFGHQTKRWNPKMKKFIFGQRSGIYIIDLQKTADHLNKAKDFLKDVASKGGNVLYIGTKKQAQSIMAEEAQKSGMYFINNRWLGGLLTNFQTVKKSIDRLKSFEKMQENGIWGNLKKKEIGRLTKEKEKLLKDLGGIRELRSLPQAVIIVDPKREEIAVREANKLGIPIVAIIDTNCDPDMIDYPIPGNDDALKSIRLITSILSESILSGRSEYMTNSSVQETKEAPAAQAEDAPMVTEEESSAASQTS